MGKTVSTRAAPPAARSGVRWRRDLAHNATAYLFLLPALLLFGLFLWWPIISAFIISFQNVNLRNEPTWVGTANFRAVLSDPVFFKATRNTFTYVVLALLFGYLVPVVLAIAVNELRGKSYFRLAFYLPAVLPVIVTALLWRWVLDPGPGLANTMLRSVGLEGLPWLQSPRTVLPAIVLMTTWGGAGGAMMVYLAALQSVPSTLYDAAELDGAGFWRRATAVTIPHIRGVMLLFLIGQIIGTVQLFTEVFALTDGGPNNASVTLMLLLYRYAFQYNQFGYASAMGVLIFLFLSGFSLVYMRLTFFKKS